MTAFARMAFKKLAGATAATEAEYWYWQGYYRACIKADKDATIEDFPPMKNDVADPGLRSFPDQEYRAYCLWHKELLSKLIQYYHEEVLNAA